MLVAATLLAITAPASGHHAPGRSYVGGHSEGNPASVVFEVSLDGSSVEWFQIQGVPGEARTCSFPLIRVFGPFPITSGADHGFAISHEGTEFSGTFPEPRKARGTLRRETIEPQCRSATLDWTAVLSEQVAEYYCTVPNLVGRKLSRARVAIRRAGCVVGHVRRARSARPKGKVISQSPKPRTRALGGLRVNLVVSRGRR